MCVEDNMSSINRLQGNSGFDFVSKSGGAKKTGSAASAAPSGGVQGASGKPSASKNEDILNISSVLGSAGGAATQVSLGGSGLSPSVAVGALKGAAAQLSKENRVDMTVEEMANQLAQAMYSAA
jgi:hypothetical protein